MLLDLHERGDHDPARQVASVPMRMGGLGLRSASRGAEAAYWACWADALPMISERNPAIAELVEHAMTHEAHREGCLAELHDASGRLDRGRVLVATHLVRVTAWQTTTRQRLK